MVSTGCRTTAQVNLGRVYEDGRDVPQDYSEAAKWYRLAAEQGQASAQSNLALMYRQGRGVPQDFIQAHMWWNLVAMQGDKGAAASRDAIAKRMTPAEVAEAEKMAREWTEKHSK